MRRIFYPYTNAEFCGVLGKAGNWGRTKISEYLTLAIVCLMQCMVATQAQADKNEFKKSHVYTLPSNIAQKLRARNSPGQRGACDQSNIFVHGLYYINNRPDERILFLGAPDYLCETNSFVSVIVDSHGNWTMGKSTEKDWRGADFLSGIPVLFLHVDSVGFFLTAEWQVEGPGTLMYYSADGVTWTSLNLPIPTSKNTEYDCCDAATISSVCVAGSAKAYISYEESTGFEASNWEVSIDDSFPHKATWSLISKTPDDARCHQHLRQDFVSHSLLEKTTDGALFDVDIDWAIFIPGATK